MQFHVLYSSGDLMSDEYLQKDPNDEFPDAKFGWSGYYPEERIEELEEVLPHDVALNLNKYLHEKYNEEEQTFYYVFFLVYKKEILYTIYRIKQEKQ